MEIDEILKKYKLQKTKCRIEILNIFFDSEIAVSEEDIMKSVNGKFNKTSIYRTLNILTEKGIIHKIFSDFKHTKYSLSIDNQCDAYVHFECKKCNSIYCMNIKEFQKPKLPNGYAELEVNVLIQGICKKCNKK